MKSSRMQFQSVKCINCGSSNFRQNADPHWSRMGYANGMTRRRGRSSRSIMRDNTKGKTKAAIQTGKSIVKPVVIAGQESAFLLPGNFLLCVFRRQTAGQAKLLSISRCERRCRNRKYDPLSPFSELLPCREPFFELMLHAWFYPTPVV